MRKHAEILRPKFEAVLNRFDSELKGLEIATWTSPKGGYFTQKLEYMTDEEGEPICSAPHPQQILKIKMAQPVAEMFMLRKEK